jgi:hypothetical protein
MNLHNFPNIINSFIKLRTETAVPPLLHRLAIHRPRSRTASSWPVGVPDRHTIVGSRHSMMSCRRATVSARITLLADGRSRCRRSRRARVRDASQGRRRHLRAAGRAVRHLRAPPDDAARDPADAGALCKAGVAKAGVAREERDAPAAYACKVGESCKPRRARGALSRAVIARSLARGDAPHRRVV